MADMSGNASYFENNDDSNQLEFQQYVPSDNTDSDDSYQTLPANTSPKRYLLGRVTVRPSFWNTSVQEVTQYPYNINGDTILMLDKTIKTYDQWRWGKQSAKTMKKLKINGASFSGKAFHQNYRSSLFCSNLSCSYRTRTEIRGIDTSLLERKNYCRECKKKI